MESISYKTFIFFRQNVRPFTWCFEKNLIYLENEIFRIRSKIEIRCKNFNQKVRLYTSCFEKKLIYLEKKIFRMKNKG